MDKITVVLDGRQWLTPQHAHQHICQSLNFPSYYGNNLDALFDCLTTYHEPQQLMLLIIYPEVILDNLLSYGEKLLDTFVLAGQENHNLIVKVKPYK